IRKRLFVIAVTAHQQTSRQDTSHQKNKESSSMSKIISALAFATLLSLPASAAVASSANWEITALRVLVTNASASCPSLEGYPDCHPDGGPAWTPRGRSR